MTNKEKFLELCSKIYREYFDDGEIIAVGDVTTGLGYQAQAMRTNDGNSCIRLWNFSEQCEMAITEPIGLMKPEQLLNACLGLSGEVGEFNDEVKKIIFHEHEYNEDKLVKELGDICWYLALACDSLSISLSDVMAHNIEKLKKRYPEGFSAEASKNRKE